MIYKKHLLVLLFSCIALGANARHASADTAESCGTVCSCHDENPVPAGIMTAHTHQKGEWMAAYMYMNMMMHGNRMGSNSATTNDIFTNYAVAPEKMTMQMHMAMLMYGLTDRLTIMAMGGYAVNNMSMDMGAMLLHHHHGSSSPGGSMAMSTSALIDTRVTALYSVLNRNSHHIVASLGVSIPTGSINRQTHMYSESGETASYCMQTGSGTLGLSPAVTYLHSWTRFSLGTQVAYDIRFGRNANGYNLGDAGTINVWGVYKILPVLSATLRAEGISSGAIKGYDPAVAAYMYNDPTANTANTGSTRTNLYAGVNYSLKKVTGLHLLAEYGRTLYEYVNGVQMASRSNIIASVQYTF